MGILTNLIGMAQKQEDSRRQAEMDRYSTIAQMPNMRPEIQEWAIDQLVGLAPKKSGLKDVGSMFKQLIAGQKKGGDQPGMGGFQQALQSTGRPEANAQIPAGPGALANVLPQQTEKIGPVKPSLMLSPQEQLSIKLDQARQTANQQRELKEQAEIGMNQIKADEDAYNARQAEETRSGMALDSWNKYQMLKKIYPDEAAKEISGWKETEQVKGAPKPIAFDDPQLIALLTKKGVPLPKSGESWWGYTDSQGNLINATKEPAKETKPSNEFSLTLKTDVEAQTAVDDFEAAKRTGRKSKYTESEYKAAKDYLTKQNRPPATIINMGETKREAKDIAEAIRDATRPPITTGLGRAGLAGEVASELSKMTGPDGKPYNLSKATTDWNATQASVRAMNGAQQTRLREATNFSVSSLNRLSNPEEPGNDLIGQLRRFIPRTKFPIINKAAINAAKNGLYGDAAASAARQLESQVTDLTFELGTVYMGGNSPTDRGIGKAQDMLAGEWSENTLRDAVDLARANLGYRLNSIQQLGPAGVSPESPYIPNRPAPVPEAPIVNRAAGTGVSLPKPPRQGSAIGAAELQKYLDANGGDVTKTRKAVTDAGWTIPK